MRRIDLLDYLGVYGGHADATPERLEHARVLLAAVNAALAAAEADGVELHLNPRNGSHVAGAANGGFRPQDCPIGAARSTHKQGQGIDLFDPKRELARWSLRNVALLERLGIVAMEDPRWTPTWCHWQTRPVPDKFAYIPDSSPAKASALPEQQAHGGTRLA